MPRTHFIAIALAGTAVASVPANAGGLLGGGAANCLCQAVQRVSDPAGKATSIGHGIRGVSPLSMAGRGHGGRIINGNLASSVNSALNVTTARSIDRRSGHMDANVGLAGRVSSDAAAVANLNGVGRSVGLAGRSSIHGTITKQVGLAVAGRAPTRPMDWRAGSPAPSARSRARLTAWAEW